MTATTSPPARRARILPQRPLRAAWLVVVFVGLLWALELADQTFFGGLLDGGGIEPRDVDGLDGILWSPLLHLGYGHLASNTVPLLVFGFLALAGGIGQFLAVTAIIWLLGGLGTWLTGAGLTVGASGVLFGWLAFLLVRGFFARSGRQIALAAVLFLVYGGVLWGVLPGHPAVSWQAHLFGALAGVLAARLVASADRAGPAGGRRAGSAPPIGP